MLCTGMETCPCIGASSDLGEATFCIRWGEDPKNDLKKEPDLSREKERRCQDRRCLVNWMHNSVSAQVVLLAAKYCKWKCIELTLNDAKEQPGPVHLPHQLEEQAVFLFIFFSEQKKKVIFHKNCFQKNVMNNDFGSASRFCSSAGPGEMGAGAPFSPALLSKPSINKSKPTTATSHEAMRRQKGKSTTQLTRGKSQEGMGASCFAWARGDSQESILLFKVFSSLSEETLPSSSSFTTSIMLSTYLNSGHIHNPAQHTTIFFGDLTLVCNGQFYEEEKHLEEFAENWLLARRYLTFLLLSLFMSSLEIWLDICSQRGSF